VAEFADYRELLRVLEIASRMATDLKDDTLQYLTAMAIEEALSKLQKEAARAQRKRAR
jgi:signal transduction histidine kinase